MSRLHRLSVLAVAIFWATASSGWAQNQYIGYVYPAGGQQGATASIRLGGQRLAEPTAVVVTGEGVSARLVGAYEVYNNQELALLREQLAELKKKDTTVSDVMVAKMAFLEMPSLVGPPEVEGLICPACDRLNPAFATACSYCKAELKKPEAAKPGAAKPKSETPPSQKEAAKQKLIERIERRLAEDERQPAVQAQRELVFAEVAVAPDAKPGRREIRIVTRTGISNALPFFIGQVPEVARQPMKTSKQQVLGKEYLAKRKRPPEEEVVRVTVPCTMNGQVAAGEVNRYRFPAKKGQRLVITAKARELVPYVADGVPGWFQAVLSLRDADGNELAYNDDFRFHPDPVLCFEVPKDDEYVLTINEALYRGRESFTYRITIGELPFVTSIFPLGARVGEPVQIEMDGWNLEKATIAPPAQDAKAGKHWIAASDGETISNYLPFALSSLPECRDQDGNDDVAHAQQVTLPIVVNGRSDYPGDWDVFEVEGKAGQTIVAEVEARRLGSPMDAFVKITGPDGKIIAMNDDHYDAGSGLNTDHADSYLMAKLPTNGKYHVHIGDTRRHAGKAYGYRLRISPPRPDFELRVLPSRIVIRGKAAASVKVFALRRDGFAGPIRLSFRDLPEGFESPGATLASNKESVNLSLKTSLTALEAPVDLAVVGSAKIGDGDTVHEAVPTEDCMQAFLWRHLLPAENLPVLVYDPSYQAPADRICPPIRAEDRPKGVKRDLARSSVTVRLKQIERLYQDWLLTDEFANRQIASIEARIIN